VRDLLVIAVVAVALFVLGSVVDLWQRLYARIDSAADSGAGEIYAAVSLAGLVFAAFAILRWRQAAREAVGRAEVEGRFRALVEEVPAITYTWDPTKPTGTSSAPYVSPQVERILGFTPEEWTADPTFWIDRMHRDDRDRVMAESDRCNRTGEPFSTEYRSIARDGREVWLRDEAVVVARTPGGRPAKVQGVMLDITAQKRVERALHEAESRYRTIVERVPAVAYVWDGADAPGSAPAAYISPQIERLLGFTADEWIENPQLWAQRCHPDDAERTLALWEAAAGADAPFTAEYRMFAADGTLVWIRDEAVPVSEGDRGRAVYQGVMFDVTEQKLIEGELASAESRFRALVEQIPAITYLEDPASGDLLYISPQIDDILGFTAEEWVGDPTLWEQRLHPADRERVVAENESDTGDAWRVDYRSVTRDGRIVWLHNDARLVRDAEGAPRYWQGVVFDITERKEAEERLRGAESRYRSLVEQLPAVVYVDAVDEVSTATYISPQYERLLGYTPEERMADPLMWLRLLHPDDLDRVQAESLRTNETGEPFDCEYRLIAKDGRVVWVRDHAYRVSEPDGSDGFWQGLLFDITESKLAEEALFRRDTILEATAFAAGRFLNAPSWTDVIDDVLERLGGAANASRAYVFENEWAANDETLVTGRFEWTGEGIASTVRSAYNQRFPYRGDFERWQRVLGSGDVIHGLTRDFPEAERADLLDLQGILACVVMPIFVGEEWWGFIGFDHCTEEHTWQPAEIDALTVAANTLGAAIGRERAELRLSETERRYQSLVEQIPAITYIEEPGTGRPLYISPQLETVLGYSRDEVRGERYWASLHPEDRDRVQAEDERTNATGEPYRVEYRQQAKDGRWVWIRDEAILVRDSGDRPLYWQGVRFDITPQKLAEDQVREAEEKYRTLIETVPAVTYIDTIADPVTALYISPQIQTMLGYTPEEWVGDPDLWWRGLDPGFLESARAAVARHNAGEPFDIEYRFLAKDGTWHWIRDQALVVNDDDGVARFSQGVMMDVTEERLAEEQLREAEQRFRAIVEHIPAVVYVDAMEWPAETVYVAPQIEEMLGITPEEWRVDVDSWENAIHPDDREETVERYLEFLRTGVPWSHEYRFVARDGRTLWVHDEATILRSEDDRPTFVQGVWFDITERKLAEEALRESEQREREAAEQLRALDEMKNTFLAAVSHELRSPLTSILGLSLTLERHGELTEADREDLLGRMSSNARKLDRLLKDLLDIDRLNRGIVAPQYRVTDVGALARRTVESLEALAHRSVLVHTDQVVIRVDPAKIERIVENLLVNAARHTDDDREIWLRVEALEGGVLIAVEDDGPGVPVDIRHEIFEPFRQGPTAATSHSPGTGIGLSLVARFAELHGGRAWVEDRKGGGASFRVFLPGGPASGAEDPDEDEGLSDHAITGRFAGTG
jgi:PAS domain S-box-containing protein